MEPSSDRARARGRLLGGALLGSFVLVALWRIALECFRAPIEEVLAFVPDDSLFYFQIAWNFPRTGRFTYDGLHDTYGFQPLWQLVLAFLAPLFEEREAFFRAGLGLLGALHVAAGLLLCRALGRHVGALAAVAAGAFWLLNPPLLRWSMGGKESVLYLLLLLLLLLHLRTLLRGPSRASGALLGVLSGLLFLARVNALVCVGLVWLAVACAPWLDVRRRVRLLAVAALAAALFVVPWLVYAQASFDSLLPTSGTAKLAGTRRYVEERWGVEWRSGQHVYKAFRMWPDHAADLARGLATPHLHALLAATLVALGAGAWALIARARELRERAVRYAPELLVLAVLAVWAVGNGVMVLFFLPQFARYGTWYAVPEALLLGVGSGLVVAAACTGRSARARVPALALLLVASVELCAPLELPVPLASRAAQALLVVLALAAALGVGVRAVRARAQPLALAALALVTAHSALPFYRGRYDHAPLHSREARGRLHRLGLWTREHLPPEAVLGAWSSGILAYFSERTVVSLEGLVNDLEYLRHGRFDHEAYVAETGIEYVFGPGRSYGDGSYSFARLEPGTYEIEWVPFPGYSFHWGGLDAYMLVRPDASPVSPRLGPEDFPFGLWRPPLAAEGR